MSTKIITYLSITIAILYSAVAAFADADVVDEMTEIAAKCDVYSSEFAAYGKAEYIAEAIWWAQFLDGWLDGDQELADRATTRAREQLEKPPSPDQEDYKATFEARSSLMQEKAERCVVVREGIEKLAAEIGIETVKFE